MTASPAAVAAAQKAIRDHDQERLECMDHDRMCCPCGDAHDLNYAQMANHQAQAVADAVATIAAREALEAAAATLAPPDPHDEDEECETCWTVRWLRTRAGEA